MKKNVNWYAIYVKARHERKVLEALLRKEIECYLPLRTETRQWSDRKKEVEEPLIRGYLFVRINIRSYYDVLVIPGVISFVAFDQKPAVIPDYQIEDLKIFLRDGGKDIEVTNEHIQKGQLVQINEGPLKDVIGEVTELRGKKRILIRIKALGCLVLAELGVNQIERFTEDTPMPSAKK
ncbi:UpxY family transcription antiterminator [Mangrovibacterium diazotrophicum]|uniref:Transcription antitermination protein nusG n=1 Tax=Mangrovibacterium diazotrophicum TaxID=1261403 RepID=A0A419W960_9BACT|nr:UpxY family transcription antiterminator [Mangrovibacterium diazotrophicum]RKD91976.1 transcription antitermination protein nusG [Mangrovibacterium diazotrophicum]